MIDININIKFIDLNISTIIFSNKIDYLEII